MLDRLCGLFRRLHRAIAGVFPPHVLNHLDRCRDVLVAFARLFGDQPQILATAIAVLLGFTQIVHDPFPDHILGQRLASAPFLRLRFLCLVLLWLGIRGRRFFVLGLGRLPQFLEQRQLLFRQLLALAAPLRLQKLPQQTPVLVLLRAFLLQLRAQIDNDLMEYAHVLGQRFGIDRRHGLCSE